MHIERQGPGRDASYGVSPRSPEEQRLLATRFSDRHVVNLPAFLRGPLLANVVRDVRRAGFRETHVEGITRESRMDAPSVLARLLFWANDPRLVKFMRDVTGCADIGCFFGRVSRFEPSAHHHAAWHDDAIEDRRVALCLNLSEGPLEGGELLIRRKGDGDPPPTAYGPPR